ncbi:MAG: CoA-binding protein [Candidatus Riflebacteria bacterium]|nr:CoA-binding protein [Candidatus Riflebacteria bacterium]
MNVAILGASNKPDRYSYKAIMLLQKKGHTPFPIHPSLEMIDGIPVYPSLKAISTPIDTITVYLSETNQKIIENDILQSSTRRVIFNPGAENQELSDRLVSAGKEALNACTLVLLSTDQF